MKVHIFGVNGKMGSALLQLLGEMSSIEEADVLVDVSHPDALLKHFFDKPLIVGSTGHTKENLEAMQNVNFPLLYAPNFSLGITLMSQMAKVMQGIEAKIDITEIHHDQKQDSPSGTALKLAEQLNCDQIHAYRRPHGIGEHRICFAFGDEEIEIRHKAHSRKAFADGALASIEWIANQPPGFYTMENVLCKT